EQLRSSVKLQRLERAKEANNLLQCPVISNFAEIDASDECLPISTDRPPRKPDHQALYVGAGQQQHRAHGYLKQIARVRGRRTNSLSRPRERSRTRRPAGCRGFRPAAPRSAGTALSSVPGYGC